MSSNSSGFRERCHPFIRKIDFPSDPVEAPLRGQCFYLDIKSTTLKSRITHRISELGGRIESFLSKDLNGIITDRAPTNPGEKPTKASTYGSAVSSLQKKNIPLSRGQALLLKSAKNKSPENGKSTDFLQNATALGVRTQTANEFIRYSSRILTVYRSQKKNQQKNVPSLETIPASLEKEKENVFVVKVEDCNSLYRPLFKKFEKFPKITYNETGCPFDEGIVLSKHNSDNQSKIRKQNSDNQSKIRKKHPAETAKGGYCEACDHWFKCTLKEHLKSNKHIGYISSLRNFQSLEAMTASISNVDILLRKHGSLLHSKKQTENVLHTTMAEEACEDNICFEKHKEVCKNSGVKEDIEKQQDTADQMSKVENSDTILDSNTNRDISDRMTTAVNRKQTDSVFIANTELKVSHSDEFVDRIAVETEKTVNTVVQSEKSPAVSERFIEEAVAITAEAEDLKDGNISNEQKGNQTTIATDRNVEETATITTEENTGEQVMVVNEETKDTTDSSNRNSGKTENQNIGVDRCINYTVETEQAMDNDVFPNEQNETEYLKEQKNTDNCTNKETGSEELVTQQVSQTNTSVLLTNHSEVNIIERPLGNTSFECCSLMVQTNEIGCDSETVEVQNTDSIMLYNKQTECSETAEHPNGQSERLPESEGCVNNKQCRLQEGRNISDRTEYGGNSENVKSGTKFYENEDLSFHESLDRKQFVNRYSDSELKIENMHERVKSVEERQVCDLENDVENRIDCCASFGKDWTVQPDTILDHRFADNEVEKSCASDLVKDNVDIALKFVPDAKFSSEYSFGDNGIDNVISYLQSSDSEGPSHNPAVMSFGDSLNIDIQSDIFLETKRNNLPVDFQMNSVTNGTESSVSGLELFNLVKCNEEVAVVQDDNLHCSTFVEHQSIKLSQKSKLALHENCSDLWLENNHNAVADESAMDSNLPLDELSEKPRLVENNSLKGSGVDESVIEFENRNKQVIDFDDPCSQVFDVSIHASNYTLPQKQINVTINQTVKQPESIMSSFKNWLLPTVDSNEDQSLDKPLNGVNEEVMKTSDSPMIGIEEDKELMNISDIPMLGIEEDKGNEVMKTSDIPMLGIEEDKGNEVMKTSDIPMLGIEEDESVQLKQIKPPTSPPHLADTDDFVANWIQKQTFHSHNDDENCFKTITNDRHQDFGTLPVKTSDNESVNNICHLSSEAITKSSTDGNDMFNHANNMEQDKLSESGESCDMNEKTLCGAEHSDKFEYSDCCTSLSDCTLENFVVNKVKTGSYDGAAVSNENCDILMSSVETKQECDCDSVKSELSSCLTEKGIKIKGLRSWRKLHRGHSVDDESTINYSLTNQEKLEDEKHKVVNSMSAKDKQELDNNTLSAYSTTPTKAKIVNDININHVPSTPSTSAYSGVLSTDVVTQNEIPCASSYTEHIDSPSMVKNSKSILMQSHSHVFNHNMYSPISQPSMDMPSDQNNNVNTKDPYLIQCSTNQLLLQKQHDPIPYSNPQYDTQPEYNVQYLDVLQAEHCPDQLDYFNTGILPGCNPYGYETEFINQESYIDSQMYAHSNITDYLLSPSKQTNISYGLMSPNALDNTQHRQHLMYHPESNQLPIYPDNVNELNYTQQLTGNIQYSEPTISSSPFKNGHQPHFLSTTSEFRKCDQQATRQCALPVSLWEPTEDESESNWFSSSPCIDYDHSSNSSRNLPTICLEDIAEDPDVNNTQYKDNRFEDSLNAEHIVTSCVQNEENECQFQNCLTRGNYMENPSGVPNTSDSNYLTNTSEGLNPDLHEHQIEDTAMRNDSLRPTQELALQLNHGDDEIAYKDQVCKPGPSVVQTCGIREKLHEVSRLCGVVQTCGTREKLHEVSSLCGVVQTCTTEKLQEVQAEEEKSTNTMQTNENVKQTLMAEHKTHSIEEELKIDVESLVERSKTDCKPLVDVCAIQPNEVSLQPEKWSISVVEDWKKSERGEKSTNTMQTEENFKQTLEDEHRIHPIEDELEIDVESVEEKSKTDCEPWVDVCTIEPNEVLLQPEEWSKSIVKDVKTPKRRGRPRKRPQNHVPAPKEEPKSNVNNWSVKEAGGCRLVFKVNLDNSRCVDRSKRKRKEPPAKIGVQCPKEPSPPGSDSPEEPRSKRPRCLLYY